MPRIDVRNTARRWQFRCPSCASTDWRATNGHFHCRNGCGRIQGLRDAKSGTVYGREEIELVGGDTDWKAPAGFD